MGSRMDKYNTKTQVKSRTNRNEKLYDDLSELNIDYINIDVDNVVELDSNYDSKPTRENYKKKRNFKDIIPEKEEKIDEIIERKIEPEENKIYDINEILKLARQDKLFESEDKKRLINTEYNILTKLDIADINKENMKKEDLKNIINDIYEREEPKKMKKYSRREEDELFKDLLADKEEDSIREEIKLKEELSEKILDIQKDEEDDIEGTKLDIKESKTEEPTKKIEKNENPTEQIAVKIEENDKLEEDEEIELEKEGKGLIIFVIIFTILVLLIGAFFAADYFFGIL